MAEKQLKRNVYVDGTLYGPDGEKPTAEVLKQIENDNAFLERSDETPAQKRARELSDQARDSDGSKSGSSKG
jgi:hypothetical protein